jgi:hypothetical protein
VLFRARRPILVRSGTKLLRPISERTNPVDRKVFAEQSTSLGDDFIQTQRDLVGAVYLNEN